MGGEHLKSGIKMIDANSSEFLKMVKTRKVPLLGDFLKKQLNSNYYTSTDELFLDDLF